ncbi:hypothetical protein, partial [Thiolapillus sp.]|uniref:hypothetical protein n=1 Tax=Thiolapillus sp. TaxID=2017437 RepID=UPI003AF7BAAA
MSKLQFQLVKSAEDASAQIVGAQTAEDIANLLEVPERQLLHIRLLDVLSGISPKTCASIAPNTGMRKRRGRQRDTATGIGDSV